ncbi:GH116 family glycosyl hydrolase [Sorangium sp. So ce381]|uniref:GH116 family glycosyl hydrolase n=1 Tax=Sorangium sp. So ce381 TaxID=3133307 RepID=UPI003F5B787E
MTLPLIPLRSLGVVAAGVVLVAATAASCGGGSSSSSSSDGGSGPGGAGAGTGTGAGAGTSQGPASSSSSAAGTGGAPPAVGSGGSEGGGPPAHVPGEPISIPAQAWSRGITDGVYEDGAPIGGFGAGTITWRFDGRFYKGRLDIGSSDQSVDNNAGFFMYQKAEGGDAQTKRLDKDGLGQGQATYSSLFPRSWVDYHGAAFPCKAKVEQYSPIIPGDYKKTSYPVGVYRWEITNPTGAPCDVAVMLTWKNDHGGNGAMVQTSGDDVGLVLTRGGGAPNAEGQGEFTLASRKAPGVVVSYQSADSVAALQSELANDGALANTTGGHSLGAIAFKATVEPGKSVIVPIVLAWDIPVTQAGSGDRWYRAYTRHFGRTGNASWTIAAEALAEHEPWLWAIQDWQTSVLDDPKYPEWLKGALFNELYYYAVAGTYWEAGAASGQPDDPDEDMFTSLESYIYPFYGTSDVRFYGSWALFSLWPDIDKQEVRQFCDSVTTTRSDRPRAIGTTAHDFGDTDTVFRKWNAYTYRDSTNWKDLNSKLVLMVYRDWALTGKTDKEFLDYCWPAVKMAMQKVKGQDGDGDGLPESNGIDQTYDDMDLHGNTAYCGGLFLAASEAAKELATAVGDASLAGTYQTWFDQAKGGFESKLWTGAYYKIDTGSRDTSRIMSDQLAGQWYARALGLPPIVDPSHAVSAFTKIYENNFKRFDGGTRGVVNVMTANGSVDGTSNQTRECWVGTSWGVVSGMIQEGLAAQAGEIGASLVDTIWKTDGLWFRTPEAWEGNGSIRAPYYMRATTLWAAKHAYDIAP